MQSPVGEWPHPHFDFAFSVMLGLLFINPMTDYSLGYRRGASKTEQLGGASKLEQLKVLVGRKQNQYLPAVAGMPKGGLSVTHKTVLFWMN